MKHKFDAGNDCSGCVRRVLSGANVLAIKRNPTSATDGC